MLGRSAVAFSLRGGDGSRGAADFVGSGGGGANGADALEKVVVEDHTGGAARKVGGLVMREGFGAGESQHSQQNHCGFVHKIF